MTPARRAFRTSAEADEALAYAGAALLKRLADGPPLAKYKMNPVGFAEEMFTWGPGEGLTDYQKEILAALVDGRVAVYGPHGLGKTMIEAIACIWFSSTREALGIDWKNPTTASAWRQLDHYLWPEIHKWCRRLRWDLMKRPPFDERTELQTLSLQLRHGEAFALASDKAESLEGAHADSIFFQFDESKTIPPSVWDSVEGAFSGTGEVMALAASTPGEEQGRFYDICSRKPGYEDWKIIHVTVDDAIKAGRISTAWVEQRAAQWGRESAVFRNRVLGEFASSESDGVIPLAWVEAAVERWVANENPVIRKLTSVGADVGGGGEGGDLTTLALRQGWRIEELRRFGRGDTMETVGRIKSIADGYGGLPVVDVIGIGAGVVARLREMDMNVYAFNAASSPPASYKDYSGELGFFNMRAWAWWTLRELLDPARGVKLELPPDDLLIGDLTAPHWRVQSGGRIIIESKDEIRKRLGRSTDSGDAVVMAFASQETEGDEVLSSDRREDLRQLMEDHSNELTDVAGAGDLWGKAF